MKTSSLPDALVEDSLEWWLSTLGEAQPKFTSAPTPGAPNELAAAEKVAGLLGLKLAPWQRFYIRVVSEKLPNGDYRFGSSLLTCPRQSGKSTVLQVLSVTRALMYKGVNVFYTAQTNMDAYHAIIIKLSETVEESRMGDRVTIRRSNTSPGIRFHNGSVVSPFTPSPKGLHGKSNSVSVVLDEIFAWSKTQGDLLLGAASPTMLVRGGKAQTLMMSTKGTSDSEFLNEKIARGQVAVEDPDSKFMFMEWSMPEGLDPMDLNNYGFHPGMQGGIIDKAGLEKIAEDLSEAPGEFKRTMANIYTETKEAVFDIKHWETLAAKLPTPAAKEVAYGFEVNAARTSAAVCAAWKGSDGNIYLKLIRNDAGTQWLMEDIPTLDMTSPLGIGADKHAQNNVVVDSLTYAFQELEIHQLTGPEWGTASAAFRARVEDGTIRHDGSPALYSAIEGAITKPYGDAGWSFSHNSAPELIAAIVAVRLVDQMRPESAPIFEVWD